MTFSFTHLRIPEVTVVEPDTISDVRGIFRELFKLSDFSVHGLPGNFVQTNYSFSRRHVLRGLHYQMHPAAQGKLVSVAYGEVYDVAVDIRKRSPTCGEWVAVALSSKNGHMLYVPPGFAHGFCVMSDEAAVVYQVTSEYSPAHERGIAWNDPRVAVAWPIEQPALSLKDANLPLLSAAQNNFED